MEVSIMLATENKQESILKRIEQVVSIFNGRTSFI